MMMMTVMMTIITCIVYIVYPCSTVTSLLRVRTHARARTYKYNMCNTQSLVWRESYVFTLAERDLDSVRVDPSVRTPRQLMSALRRKRSRNRPWSDNGVFAAHRTDFCFVFSSTFSRRRPVAWRREHAVRITHDVWKPLPIASHLRPDHRRRHDVPRTLWSDRFRTPLSRAATARTIVSYHAGS